MMNLVNEIEIRLQALAPSVCRCRDDSHQHLGHAGNNGGGHYSVLVVSDAFVAQNRIARQRMVNALLQEFFPLQIHALSIRALTEAEWANLQQKESV